MDYELPERSAVIHNVTPNLEELNRGFRRAVSSSRYCLFLFLGTPPATRGKTRSHDAYVSSSWVEVLSWPLDWSGGAVCGHGADCTAVEAGAAVVRWQIVVHSLWVLRPEQVLRWLHPWHV